jgi:hypothetical protein
LRGWAVAGFICAALVVSPNAHSADCTAPDASVSVYPGTGEPNVPANTLIDIHLVGDPLPSVNEFSVRVSGLVPPPLRVPETIDGGVSYIQSVRLFPCFYCFPFPPPFQVSVLRNGTTISSFVTGVTADGRPPPQPTGATAVVDKFDTHPDGGLDCIKDRVRQVHLFLPDAGKPVVYTLRENGQIISADEVNPVGSFYCTGQPRWQGDTSWVVSPGQHTIQIEAVDRAGNRSAPAEVTFNADCSSTTTRGSGGPGGVGQPGGGPVSPTTGCTSAAGLSGALFFGLGLLVRSRGRKH